MTSGGHYRRPLPEHLIAFSSPDGRRLFHEALADGTLEGYFPLAEQFHTQADPAFCGLGTLVVVLNALAIDPGRVWKGPWRWYSEDLLDCCLPLDVVRSRGLTFGELACLARCNGARVDARRADGATLDELRAAIVAAASSPAGPHVIAAYSRRTLGQTGDGHYSPIGGYHRGRDLVLLLDVARFKYPPHWVPLPLLWEAMSLADAATGLPRGYLVLHRGDAPRAAFCSIDCHGESFHSVARQLEEALPRPTRELREHGAPGEPPVLPREPGESDLAAPGDNAPELGAAVLAENALAERVIGELDPALLERDGEGRRRPRARSRRRSSLPP